MLQAIKKAKADKGYKFGPHTKDRATQAFFDFDSELSQDSAAQLLAELKVIGDRPRPALMKPDCLSTKETPLTISLPQY